MRLAPLGGPFPNLAAAPDDAQIGLIYGIKPASKQEWWTAVALWSVGWPFEYQVPLRGGRIAGGQVLDFLVHTLPRETPLQVFSTYYHAGHLGMYDKWKLALVQSWFGARPVIFWSNEVDTKEHAILRVRKAFGPGPR